MGQIPACRPATTGPRGPLRPRLGPVSSPEHGQGGAGCAGSTGGEAADQRHREDEGGSILQQRGWGGPEMVGGEGALGGGCNGVEAALRAVMGVATCTGRGQRWRRPKNLGGRARMGGRQLHRR
jgi:hypothetical protein